MGFCSGTFFELGRERDLWYVCEFSKEGEEAIPGLQNGSRCPKCLARIQQSKLSECWISWRKQITISRNSKHFACLIPVDKVPDDYDYRRAELLETCLSRVQFELLGADTLGVGCQKPNIMRAIAAIKQFAIELDGIEAITVRSTIYELNLPLRIQNRLDEEGFLTIASLLKVRASDLRAKNDFGECAVQAIETELARHGLSLRKEITYQEPISI